ncbi:hypothetical protein H0H92_002895 [Tricholoma furcatifolium]|nr:hypothetical protein H0H92_002895 [Tricholoma furcatifolium]
MHKTRPILKTNNLSFDCFPSPAAALPFKVPTTPHVHFPPTPTLAEIRATHSSFVYDRAPIVVGYNDCQLPERGGRDYSVYPEDAEAHPFPDGSYFDPRFSSIMAEPTYCSYLSHVGFSPPSIEDLPSGSSSLPEESVNDTNIPPDLEPDTTVYPLVTPHHQLPNAAAFLPHLHDLERRPPQRPKPKRKQTGPVPRVRPRRWDSLEYTEEGLSLDGCLGGF